MITHTKVKILKDKTTVLSLLFAVMGVLPQNKKYWISLLCHSHPPLQKIFNVKILNKMFISSPYFCFVWDVFALQFSLY
jgi:hypothetical protein